MGSGQPIADPFLGFIRRVFWGSEPPTVREGIFGAVWALNHTIELTPGQVGGAPQLAILEKESGKWKARKLSDEELGEPQEQYSAVEEYLGDYRKKLHSAAEEEEIAVPKRVK